MRERYHLLLRDNGKFECVCDRDGIQTLGKTWKFAQLLIGAKF